MSDLHFEFRENSRYIKQNRFPVTGDILVLAGDIFYLKDRVAPLGNFWEWASKNYRQVLIVPRNHEYYNYCDVMERGLQWRWMFKENVGYYQNQVLRIDDTDFIMSTFWSQSNRQTNISFGKDLTISVRPCIKGNCSKRKHIIRCMTSV